jgi:hypothetical protein
MAERPNFGVCVGLLVAGQKPLVTVSVAIFVCFGDPLNITLLSCRQLSGLRSLDARCNHTRLNPCKMWLIYSYR